MKINKQAKSLVVFGAIIVVLLLVWLGSSLIPGLKPAEGTTPATTLATEILFESNLNDVAYLEIDNEKATFKLVSEEVKDQEGKVTLLWTIDGMGDYPFSSSAVDNIARVAGRVYLTKEIAQDVTDFSPYGLDKPTAVLRVVMKDGTQHEIKFGKEIPSGYYDYVTVDQTGRVCTIASSTGDKIRSTLLDLLDKTSVIGLEANKLQKLEFNRAKDQLHLVSDIKLVGEVGSGTEYLDFTITEPVRRSGTSESLSKLVNESVAASVSQFVEIDPKDLALYGLDQPAYLFNLSSADKSVRLMIGSQADGSSYYAMTDQVPAVFTVAASSFTTIDMKVTEMLDRFVALESIWAVEKIEADILGTRFVTEIQMEKSQTADDETVVFTLDGENAKIFSEKDKSLYNQFYQSIIGILIDNLDTEANPENTKDARIVFHIREDKDNNIPAHTKIVEFARRDDYTYYVFIDGIYTGYYIDGEKAFTSTRINSEGVLVSYKMMRYAMDHAVDGVFNTQEGYQLD